MGDQESLRRLTLATVQFALFAVWPVTSRPAWSAPAPQRGKCQALRAIAFDGLSVLSADMAGPDVRTQRPFCRVAGVVRPTPASEVGFQLWLPSNWSGRYVQLGNGGFAGNIDEPSLQAEIRRGNAAAMTDTGHKAGQFDASWALGRPDRIIHYGHRSIKVTSDAASRLISCLLRRASQMELLRRLFERGRQALMAAQRYPNDWDGILAGAPAVSWTRQLATFAAIQHRLLEAPVNWLPAAKLPAIQRAALAGCPRSTISQGVAKDPRLCTFDARTLLCRGVETVQCLTPHEAQTLELIRAGPSGPTGRPHYFGFEPTSAAGVGGWDRWIIPVHRNSPDSLTFATQAYRHLVLDEPSWTVDMFEQRDLAFASERKLGGHRLAQVLDADDADLSPFAARGSKLIMYFGWADPLLSPRAGVDHFERVTQEMGGLARTQRFFRLFMIPGMQHCQGGLGPNAFGQAWVAPGRYPDGRHDVRRALESWVERGKAPAALRAVKYRGDPLRGEVHSIQEIPVYPALAGPVLTAG